MAVYELNLDGLVGPTHHYAGLSKGNIASTANALSLANPQAAALQGLQKMRFLHRLGVHQGILPPHERPNLHLLQQMGFEGTPEQQLRKAHQYAPHLLSACFSASSMWAANAATVSASSDCEDGLVHFTAANLISTIHRHQEASFSKTLLERLFLHAHYFKHHDVLPRSLVTTDEGAANFSRLCSSHDEPGLALFVYGKTALHAENALQPKKYMARQTREASEAIARAHGLNPLRTVFVQQHPDAIDAGVFHNDVIATANEHLLLVHEGAFVNQKAVFSQLRDMAAFDLQIIEVPHEAVSLEEAVSSYLFNSQIITLPDASMAMIAPTECENMPGVKRYLDALQQDSSNPICHIHYLDVKQSMRNGGGPACLRLRVPLTEDELAHMHPNVLVTEPLLDNLENWVKTHYRTALHSDDLCDPKLIDETHAALDALTSLLALGSIYPFQQV